MHKGTEAEGKPISRHHLGLTDETNPLRASTLGPVSPVTDLGSQIRQRT